MKFYYWLVTVLGLLERRCQTCKKWMGFKRARGMKLPLGLKPISHAWCIECQAEFEAAQDAVAERNQQWMPPRKQHRSKLTLRRTTGGWSGAVAAQRSSH